MCVRGGRVVLYKHLCTFLLISQAVGTLTESVQQAMVTRPVTPPHGPVAAIRVRPGAFVTVQA